MIEALLAVFVLLMLVAFARLFWRTETLFDFPVFMSVMFAGTFMPQLYALYYNSYHLPVGSFEKMLAMLDLCVVACWLGYAIPPWVPLRGLVFIRPPTSRLWMVGLALSAVGNVACIGMMTGTLERDGNGQATGTFTILFFLMWSLFPSAAILSYLAFRRPSVVSVVVLLSACWFPVLSALTGGRRTTTISLALTLLFILYWVRGIRPSRLVLVPSILFASVMIQVMNEYRGLVNTIGVAAVTEFDMQAAMQSADRTPAPEMSMAAYHIDHTGRMEYLNLGVSYWNNMVFRYVPAQFIGQAFKEGLTFPVNPPPFQRMIDFPRYAPPGTTPTGIGDSYGEFGYFGCLVFAAIGYLFRCLQAAYRRGSLPAAFLYASSITTAMLAGTHQTIDFLPGIVFNTLCIVPLCRQSKPEQG